MQQTLIIIIKHTIFVIFVIKKDIMKKIITLLAIILLGFSSKAQQTYSFSYYTDAYSDLTGMTILNDSTWDDPYFLIPVGFNFPFYDSLYTYIVINPVGYGSWLTPSNTAIIDGNIPQPIILPVSTDLIDRGYNTTTWSEDGNTLSPISYTTDGSIGNQILKIEFKNAGFYDELDNTGISLDSISFQVWLYENGDIEFRYGPRFGTTYSTNIGIYPFYNYFNESPTQDGMEVSDSITFPIANIAMAYPTIPLNTDNGMVYRFSSNFVGINHTQNNEIISLFPNPVSTQLNIVYSSNTSFNSITITNINGEIINQINNFSGNKIDVSYYDSGIYFITFETNNQLTTTKFIIE